MKKLVVLSGAGISAESGIRTFRDMGGLWEEYDIMEVASPQGWKNNMELVLQFYNERRKQLANCIPNKAHYKLAELEKYFDVNIITQNVDDLHERAGSSNILHLHGELTKAVSCENKNLIYDIKYNEIKVGDKCKSGFQLRPFIVWFGEPVPLMDKAIEITKTADIFLIIGTSLNVYPAAGLINYVKINVPIYLIDPNNTNCTKKVTFIKETACKGMDKFFNLLVNNN